MKLIASSYSFSSIGECDIGDIVVIHKNAYLILSHELWGNNHYFEFFDVTKNEIISRYADIRQRQSHAK